MGNETEKIKYSEQACVMINNLKDFNKIDFEKWFLTNLIIGSNNVLQYIIDKQKSNISSGVIKNG